MNLHKVGYTEEECFIRAPPTRTVPERRPYEAGHVEGRTEHPTRIAVRRPIKPKASGGTAVIA